MICYLASILEKSRVDRSKYTDENWQTKLRYINTIAKRKSHAHAIADCNECVTGFIVLVLGVVQPLIDGWKIMRSK